MSHDESRGVTGRSCDGQDAVLSNLLAAGRNDLR